MNSEEALGLCQAYWDDEINSDVRDQIDVVLARDPELAAIYEQENEFRGFLRIRSPRVPTPANLVDGIQARLDKERAANAPVAPVIPLRTASTFPRRTWIATAATIAIAAGLALYLRKPAHECPYMVACADATAQVLDGRSALEMQSSDRRKLAAFVGGKVKLALKEVPALTAFQMNPTGAGTISFDALKAFNSPDAAFVEYKTPAGEVAALFLHPWAGEPEAFNKTEYDGQTYWAANHDRMAMAIWKCDETKMIVTVVTTRSKQETLKMAEEVRKAYAQAVAVKANSLTNSGSQVAHARN